jgi:hypothetical protein
LTAFPKQRLAAEVRLALETGRLVLATSSLELEIDELLFLAEDRMRISKAVKRFPVTLAEKIDSLAEIEAALGLVPDSAGFTNGCKNLVSIRNNVAHGRVSSLIETSIGFLAHYQKRGRPVKVEGIQNLSRDSYQIRENDFEQCHIHLRNLFRHVETLRLAVWRNGDGWPSYVGFQGGDPFGYSPRSLPPSYEPQDD